MIALAVIGAALMLSNSSGAPVPKAAALDRSAITSRAASTTDALLRALHGFNPVGSNSAFTNYGGHIDWQAYPRNEIQYADLLRGAARNRRRCARYSRRRVVCSSVKTRAHSQGDGVPPPWMHRGVLIS